MGVYYTYKIHKKAVENLNDTEQESPTKSCADYVKKLKTYILPLTKNTLTTPTVTEPYIEPNTKVLGSFKIEDNSKIDLGEAKASPKIPVNIEPSSLGKKDNKLPNVKSHNLHSKNEEILTKARKKYSSSTNLPHAWHNNPTKPKPCGEDYTHPLSTAYEGKVTGFEIAADHGDTAMSNYKKSTKTSKKKAPMSVTDIMAKGIKPKAITWEDITAISATNPQNLARIYTQSVRMEHKDLPILNLSLKERGQLKHLLKFLGEKDFSAKIALTVYDWWRFKDIVKDEEGISLGGTYPSVGALLKHRKSINILWMTEGEEFLESLNVGQDTKPDKPEDKPMGDLSVDELNAMMKKQYLENN
jgi:hypothetical protein